MTDDDYPITESPLTQTVKRNGKSVDVEIYKGPEPGWSLEIVDEYGNSTVWDDLFETDEMALKEALDSVDKEGIDVFIGSPGKTPKS